MLYPMAAFTQRFSFVQRWLALAMTGLLLAALILGSCKKNDDGTAPVAALPAVQLANNAALGSFLMDGQGHTLYYFALDVNGSNACGTGACAAEWPVFYAAARPWAPG